MTHVLAVFGADIVSLFECPSMLSTAWGANTQMHEHTYTHRLRHSRRHWTTVDHSHGQRWHCRPASAELLSNLRLCPGLHLSICSGWSWEASAFWQNVEREKKDYDQKNIFVPKCLQATCCPLSSGLDAWHEWFVCVTKNLTFQTYNREGKAPHIVLAASATYTLLEIIQ